VANFRDPVQITIAVNSFIRLMLDFSRLWICTSVSEDQSTL